MKHNGKIYGLIGRTLGHSWSLPIHHALGCPSYRLIELEPDALPAFLSREDIGGLNVTMPYKKAVLPYCDRVDAYAAAIGSANTLVRGADGKLGAWNTDAIGFRDMACLAGISFQGQKVLILGSGGASLSVQMEIRVKSSSYPEAAKTAMTISNATRTPLSLSTPRPWGCTPATVPRRWT